LSLLVSCCSTKQQVRVSTWIRFGWKSWGLVGHFCVEINSVAKDVVYDHDAWKLLVELEDGRIVRLTGYKYAGSQYEVGQRIEIISPIREDGGALFRPAK
ncbi:hypothetical protein, partial [Acidovorax sp.]|uniref:hypothetical protein n=1 Tax=Acidovorax sp. TaxID=1872122 RepID=UPI0027BA6FBF